ncbi:toll/interleukin-1 receptor domain-containing protein [Rhizobium leguminosarum]|uniref:toll/interleukin-1 receptor domain-containing protein n=1 Tax=Rhizobium leguminosarum TaxID=384 RepID=UPI003F959732
MSYEYDVFISYKRHRFQTAWIIEYFLPYLEEQLINYTAAQCNRSNVRLFFDQTELDQDTRRGLPFSAGIEPGEKWQKSLITGITKSRCMIALYTPTYFHSKWCLAELQAFEERAAITGNNVIIPISIFSQKDLPASARNRQMFSLDDYVIDGPSFHASKLFPEFLAQLKLIAQKVAEAVCNAPEFGPWPAPALHTEFDPVRPPPVGRF